MTVFAVTWCYVLLAWVLLEVGLRAWAAPWRVVGLPSGPMAGTLPVRIEPGEIAWQAAAGPPEPGLVPCVSPTGEAFWSTMELAVVDPVHVGATEDWSPAAEVAAAGQSDRTEGEILADFDRLVAGWYDQPAWFLDFRAQSMKSHAYRMIDTPSREFTPRESMELEALILA